MQPTVFILFFLFTLLPFQVLPFPLNKQKSVNTNSCKETKHKKFWSKCYFLTTSQNNESTTSPPTWMLPQLRHCNYQFLSLLLSVGAVLKLQYGRLKTFLNETDGFFTFCFLGTICSSGNSVPTEVWRRKISFALKNVYCW